MEIYPTPSFRKDVKKLKKKHVDFALLDEVVGLIQRNSKQSKRELKRRHQMHKLKGEWKDSLECHVANVGDWLVVWCVKENKAYLQRTGTHDEIFRK